jgi:hypothetical protein
LKPGGVSMSSDDILLTGSRAVDRSILLHTHLTSSLQLLENNYQQTRVVRLEHLRRHRVMQESYQQHLRLLSGGEMEVMTSEDGGAGGGIDIDDPILRYDFNHSSVASMKAK